MKKISKIVISLLLLVLLSLSLVGCKQLDDLKKNRGIYLDESKEEIELRGQVYEKVLERVMFGNTEWETYLIADEWSLTVTDRDIPVLLAKSYGDTVRYNSRDEEDPVILCVPDYRENNSSVNVFYCRSDYLDTLKAKLDNVELDQFYYTKMMFSEPDNKVVYKKQLVSGKAAEVIRKTLARPNDPATDLDPQTGYPDYAEFKDLRYTDKDLLFTNDINLEIGKTSTGDYYIYGAYSKESPMTEDLYWKKVAPEDNALLNELFSSDYVETFVPEDVIH